MAESLPTYRCPVSNCCGWVDYIDEDLEEDDEPFWGCGMCAGTWYDKANLLEEIGEIVSRFDHRRACYRKVKGEWMPADPADEPENYEELVEEEPEDEADDYVRG